MSEPTLYRKPTDAEVFADEVVWDETGMVPVERCNQCGGSIATIRGRFPDSLDRTVCPTCLVETMEHLVTNEPGAGIGDNDD